MVNILYHKSGEKSVVWHKNFAVETDIISVSQSAIDVYVGRINEIGEYSDNYLHKLSEYYLTKDLNEYIKEITDDKGRANASIFTGQSKDYILSELEKNPKIVFEKLQDSYWLYIELYYNISKDNYNIDYESIYNIYNKIFEIGMMPRNIYFRYYSEKMKAQILSVRIDKKYFPDINSPDDLKPFFEKEIKSIVKPLDQGE